MVRRIIATARANILVLKIVCSRPWGRIQESVEPFSQNFDLENIDRYCPTCVLWHLLCKMGMCKTLIFLFFSTALPMS